jgi:hypothetical protein
MLLSSIQFRETGNSEWIAFRRETEKKFEFHMRSFHRSILETRSIESLVACFEVCHSFWRVLFDQLFFRKSPLQTLKRFIIFCLFWRFLWRYFNLQLVVLILLSGICEKWGSHTYDAREHFHRLWTHCLIFSLSYAPLTMIIDHFLFSVLS